MLARMTREKGEGERASCELGDAGSAGGAGASHPSAPARLLAAAMRVSAVRVSCSLIQVLSATTLGVQGRPPVSGAQSI
eukprot:12811989-Heterocapsa_arctica.AAC.1